MLAFRSNSSRRLETIRVCQISNEMITRSSSPGSSTSIEVANKCLTPSFEFTPIEAAQSPLITAKRGCGDRMIPSEGIQSPPKSVRVGIAKICLGKYLAPRFEWVHVYK